ncbi:MAG: crosslink repair DNA glycosylase YcaQ family protein, partial [Candidatus Thorarchaeota archaeon]
LNTGDQLVRVSAFRGTAYVVHINNLGMILGAIGPVLEVNYRKHPNLKKLTEREIEEHVENLVSELGETIISVSEIKKRLPKEKKILRPLMRIAMARGLMVRASASHARSNRTSYAYLPKWISKPKFKPLPQEKALPCIVKMYIEAFGPVTLDDLTWWLGLKKSDAKSRIEEIVNETTKVELDETEYFMIPKDLEFAASINPVESPQIWFLPYEDHFPKGFKDRSWWINEDVQQKLFPRLSEFYWPPKLDPPPKGPHKGMFRQGEIRPSIWLNGKAVGRWELAQYKKEFRVVYGLFEKIGGTEKVLIDEKKDALEDFINNRLVPIS